MQKLPTIEECFNILDENMVPDHIVEHSKMVARVGHVVTEALNRENGLALDVDLVVVSCLLHDVKKMHCIETGCDHALKGYEYLKGLGLEEVAHVVRQHYRLDPENKDFHRLAPVHICFYADNRVKHNEIVSVKERFKDILERYGRDKQSIKEIKGRLHETLELEGILFDGLSFAPGELESKVASVELFTGEYQNKHVRCHRRTTWETI